MSDLTAKFVAFEAEVAANHAEVMAALADMQSALDLVASNGDLALENGAANTKALLAALGQTGACFPCPTPSITVPPTSTVPSEVDTVHCQRSQWIITAIQNILTQFDTLQSFNVIGSFNVINDAIGQIVGAIAAGDTIPVPSFPETVQIVGTYVNYAGERAFSGVDLSSQFAPLYGPLVSAVNFTSTATDAQAAYNAIIDASSASAGAKFLFKALGYNELWSYAYDATSSPDVSAFDGSACGGALADLGSCTAFGGALVTHGAHDFYDLVLQVAYPGHPAYITGDYFGWSFQITFNDPPHAIGIYALDTSDAGYLANSQQMGDDPFTFTVHTHAVAVQTLNHEPDAHPFTVRICPPV